MFGNQQGPGLFGNNQQTGNIFQQNQQPAQQLFAQPQQPTQQLFAQQPMQQPMQQPNQFMQNQQPNLMNQQNQVVNQHNQMHSLPQLIQMCDNIYRQNSLPTQSHQLHQFPELKPTNSYGQQKVAILCQTQQPSQVEQITMYMNKNSRSLDDLKMTSNNFSKIYIKDLKEQQLNATLFLKKIVIAQSNYNQQKKEIDEQHEEIKNEKQRIADFVSTLKSNKVQMQQIPSQFIINFVLRLEKQLKIVKQQTIELEYMLKNTKPITQDQESQLTANVLADLFIYFNKVVQEVFICKQDYLDFSKKYDLRTAYNHIKDEKAQKEENSYKQEQNILRGLKKIIFDLMTQLSNANDDAQSNQRNILYLQ